MKISKTNLILILILCITGILEVAININKTKFEMQKAKVIKIDNLVGELNGKERSVFDSVFYINAQIDTLNMLLKDCK